jgi:hypothetical protein
MENSQSSGDLSKPSVDSVLTDVAVAELRKQSENGCLLCSFDTWDLEEWD